ncbi:MAG: hypothetical protein LBK40_07105, partial [Spirochaetaceae bacterium]|nr:hypothetical protein [Spirochaetaceae bacterium]
MAIGKAKLPWLTAFVFLEAAFFAYPGEPPEAAKLSFPENMRPEFLWALSWNYKKNIDNRWNLLFSLPPQAKAENRSGGLDLRFQVLDRRPEVSWQNSGLTYVSAGIYHRATGSRLLYGQLDEWGLPARIRNPWIRSLPLAENHSPSLADLKNDISTSQNSAAYLYLGSPGLSVSGLGTWNVFFTALAREAPGDSESGPGQNPASLFTFSSVLSPDLGGGIQGSFSNRRVFRMEGFFTDQRLEARRPSSWFSTSPPLPERDFRLSAFSLYYASANFGIASDGAFSETFAYGRGAYGNLGIRFGGRTWKLSLAADAAGGRYVGRDGKIPGSALRAGGSFEKQGKRSALFRASATLRARSAGEGISKSAITVNFRFPQGKNSPLFKLSGISLNLKRDNDILDSSPKPQDSAAISTLFQRGALGAGLGGAVSWEASLEPLPWPDPSRIRNPSWEGNGRISARIQALTLEARAAYTSEYNAAPYWERTFSAVFNR